MSSVFSVSETVGVEENCSEIPETRISTGKLFPLVLLLQTYLHAPTIPHKLLWLLTELQEAHRASTMAQSGSVDGADVPWPPRPGSLSGESGASP